MKLYTIKFCMHFAMISFNFYFACLKCGCLVVGIFQLSLFYYKLRYLTRSDAAHSPTHLIFFFFWFGFWHYSYYFTRQMVFGVSQAADNVSVQFHGFVVLLMPTVWIFVKLQHCCTVMRWILCPRFEYLTYSTKIIKLSFRNFTSN